MLRNSLSKFNEAVKVEVRCNSETHDLRQCNEKHQDVPSHTRCCMELVVNFQDKNDQGFEVRKISAGARTPSRRPSK